MNMQQMIQAMNKMQRQYQKDLDVLGAKEFSYTANGAVKVTLKGSMEMVSVEFLDKDVIEDPEMLADMIKMAYDGTKAIINEEEEKIQAKYQSMAKGGMPF